MRVLHCPSTANHVSSSCSGSDLLTPFPFPPRIRPGGAGRCSVSPEITRGWQSWPPRPASSVLWNRPHEKTWLNTDHHVHPCLETTPRTVDGFYFHVENRPDVLPPRGARSCEMTRTWPRAALCFPKREAGYPRRAGRCPRCMLASTFQEGPIAGFLSL